MGGKNRIQMSWLKDSWKSLHWRTGRRWGQGIIIIIRLEPSSVLGRCKGWSLERLLKATWWERVKPGLASVSEACASVLFCPQRCPVRAGGSRWVILLSSELSGISKAAGSRAGKWLGRSQPGTESGLHFGKRTGNWGQSQRSRRVWEGTAGPGRVLLMPITSSGGRRRAGSERLRGTYMAQAMIRKWGRGIEKRDVLFLCRRKYRRYINALIRDLGSLPVWEDRWARAEGGSPLPLGQRCQGWLWTRLPAGGDCSVLVTVPRGRTMRNLPKELRSCWGEILREEIS